jgi:hypothetical protein
MLAMTHVFAIARKCYTFNSDWRTRPNRLIGFLIFLCGIYSWQALAVTPVSPVVVTSQITVTYTGYTLNRSTKTYETQATLANKSSTAIQTPIQLAISNISQPTVTLANPTGVLADGTPYVNVPVSDGTLSPAETVKSLLKFNNPKRVNFTFSHSVLGVLPAANHPPVANAGSDTSAPVGQSVTLSAINSSDEDGDNLTYHWQLLEKPVNSTAQLTSSNTLETQISIDRKGSYRIELIVNDGKVDSQPAYVTINTENSKPVAKAGEDQTVKVKQTALLDGGNSSDVDGDPLTYNWELLAKPGNSVASLQNDTTQSPSLIPDLPGSYTVQLKVNDGLLDSLPDQLIVSTENSKPVANAGSNQIALVGDAVTLDGSTSSDIDNDPLSYVWSVINKPVNSNPELKQHDQVQAILTPDLPGDYVAQLIVNDSKLNSDPATSLVTVSAKPVVNRNPQITSSPVTSATVENLYSYNVHATDSDNDTLTYALTTFPSGMTINSQSGLISWTPGANQISNQSVSVTVTDGKGGSDSQSFTISVSAADQTTVPNLVDQSRSSAEAVIQQAKLNVGALTFQHNNKADGSVITQSPAAGSSVKIGTVVNLTVSIGPNNGLPPNPATVAPTIDPTVATNTYDATKFLYTGPNAVQSGMQASTINPKLVAVVQGKVLGKDNQALPGVTISVNGHPEYGQTLSRADGKFDLVVNGGEYLAINYAKQNYLPAQRQQRIPLRDYSLIDEVVLIQPDSTVSPIDLSKNDSFQIAQSSVVTDASGNRQVTILFPQGTGASMLLADGSTQPLSSMHVRATEYTVGSNGPEAMPGALPPTVAYTYAVELSVDEAIAAGAQQVSFSNPVPLYVDNFLGFSTGTKVPTAYYDFKLNAWIPVNDGQIIKILNINNGKAELDTDGDAVIDNGTALGITEAERQKLATLFPVGHSVSRVMLSHFSPWDLNYPVVTEDGAKAPNNEEAKNQDQDKLDDACEESGSIIECENQILGEHLPIAGSTLSLNYRSDRVAGRTSGKALHIPVSGSSIPNVLRAIDVRVSIAGQLFKQRLAPQPNQTLDYIWDGKDSYGRLISGGAMARIDIDYIYDGFFALPANVARSFGILTGNNSGIRARERVRLTQSQIVSVQNVDLKSTNMAGWSLDVHHVYDPTTQTLYLGDGTRQTGVVASSGAIISTIDDENGVWKTKLKSSQEAFSPDGSRFSNASLLCQILKTNPGEQVPIVFAGEYALKGCESSGNDGPVSSVRLGSLGACPRIGNLKN